MREIVFDTETTGLDPAQGHRVVEIGAIELLNAIPTGQSFHVYLDPQRDMPQEAFRVHGLSSEFLAGKPEFSAVLPDFLAFIGQARLVAHNAEFDFRFLNAELSRTGAAPLEWSRIVDTLALARRKFPGASNSLDALCARFGIDASRRVKHGALLDAEILADVYAELLGGRQAALMLGAGGRRGGEGASGDELLTRRPAPLAPRLSAAEIAAHETFVEGLGDKAAWRLYDMATSIVVD